MSRFSDRTSFTHRSYVDRWQLIEQLRRPTLAAFRQEVEKIPDRGKQIYAPVVWVAVWAGMKRGFGGIEMMDFAIRFAAKHTESRMLSSVTFDMEILVEITLAAGEQPDFVPSPPPRPFPELSDFNLGYQYKICFLGDVRSDRIVSIGPHGTHRTGGHVGRAPHHVIHNESIL